MERLTKDWRIVREGGIPIVINEDYEEQTRFTSDWTDAQIRRTIELIGTYYNKGVEFGKWKARRLIREALGINNII
jgi:hypothetical protein